jgi:DNA polymerase-3 subunit gamma/tau
MGYLVLARKYRPQNFDEVVGQGHVTQTLTNAIRNQRVAHAILFSGPRGTGKTTVARILAKAMNCMQGATPQPCNECRSCIEITSSSAADVFEIDGASNNSVDQVRELRENVKYMPAYSPHKIYIIDEVHMLSTAAFNALLKTLEEPPPHIMFLFATTEAHKIPITILSRCQRYDFRRIEFDQIVSHMALLCQKENVALPEESLAAIAREAGGSMRDALSLLDQVMTCSEGPLTHDQVLDILGTVDRRLLVNLADVVLQGDTYQVLENIDVVFQRGQDLKKLYQDLITHFRHLLVIKLSERADHLVDLPQAEVARLRSGIETVSDAALNHVLNALFRDEAAIRLSMQPRLALETSLIRICELKPALPIDALIHKVDQLRQQIIEGGGLDATGSPDAAAAAVPTKPRMKGPDADASSASVATATAPSPPKPIGQSPYPPEDDADCARFWKALLATLQANHPALAANLKAARLLAATVDELEIELQGNDFNLKRVRRKESLSAVKAACHTISGQRPQIIIHGKTVDPTDRRKKKELEAQVRQRALSHPLVAEAIELFSGKVVDVKIMAEGSKVKDS